MVRNIVRFQKVSSTDISSENNHPIILNNWSLILAYLKVLEKCDSATKYHKALIDSEIAVGQGSNGSLNSNFQLISSCLVVVIKQLDINYVDNKDKPIFKCIENAIRACENRKDGAFKTGEPFEQFFLNIFMLRILLRDENNNLSIDVSWNELFSSLKSFCIQQN